jgi:hypothetical protein
VNRCVDLLRVPLGEQIAEADPMVVVIITLPAVVNVMLMPVTVRLLPILLVVRLDASDSP